MSIQLRSAVPADAPALLAIYAPYVEQTAITFEYDVPTEAEFAYRIETTLQNYPYLVAEQDGVPVGYAYAGKFHERAAYDWSVETSIYVEQHRKRQGIGRLLHDALEQELQRRHPFFYCFMCWRRRDGPGLRLSLVSASELWLICTGRTSSGQAAV